MVTRNDNPAPFIAVHPGMMIRPELEERGISQKDFAKMIGTQPSHLSEVFNGKRTLTTELALKIEYEIDAATANRKTDAKHETVAVTIPVHDRNLLQELVRKFGWACVF